jgi:drug/metabolite transporter (DMT)-like permease
MSFHQNTVYLVGASVFALAVAPVATRGGESAAAFLLRAWEWPEPTALLLLALTGPIAVGGTILLTQAYRSAPPGAVTTVEYTALIWAALWGLVVFGEVPNLATVVGAVLIVGSGAFAMTRASATRSPA